MLAEQYLQRYRERGDVGDVLRSEAAAQRSLRIDAHGNIAALQALSAAQLTLHRFRDALATTRRARREAPRDPSLALAEAALRLELGDRGAAQRALSEAGDSGADSAVASRFAELTGDLPRARRLLAAAAAHADATYGIPNERRAWFHVRLGELAFAAGDLDVAQAEEKTALERFPEDVAALTDTARFSAALGRWNDTAAYAGRAVRLVPSPENLALLGSAQARLGAAAAARATLDEIVAVERLGNAQHLVDRLLALAYADRGVRLEDAFAIACRELTVRDDVFAEDTLAWTAARAGHWEIARTAARRATAWNTADSRIWYHAGVIAEHAGAEREALAEYRRALELNPHFDAVFADDARARVSRLEHAGG